MEEKQKNNKIVWCIISIVIIAAGIMLALNGFKVGLYYSPNNTIELNIAEDEKIGAAKIVIDKMFEDKEVITQKMEGTNNLKLTAKSFTQEEKVNLVNKLNEVLDLEISNDDVKIEENKQIKLRDALKNYVKAIIIVTIIILIYLIVRYKKLGVLEILSEAILALMLSQILALAVIAIAQFEISITIIAILAIMYISTLYSLTNEYEKKI